MRKVNPNKPNMVETKPVPNTAEDATTSTIQAVNDGRHDDTNALQAMDAKRQNSEWLKNIKGLLSEMQADSERFRRGIAEAKRNLKVLNSGLSELDRRNILTDRGIALVHARILEMETDFAQTEANGFEGPRSPRFKEDDLRVSLGRAAVANNMAASEQARNDQGANSQSQAVNELVMMATGVEYAEEESEDAAKALDEGLED